MSLLPHNLSLDEVNQRWLPPLERSFGVRLTAISAEELRAEYTVSELLLQPFGILHGGVHCVVAESLGSIAAGMSVKEGMTAVGQNMQASYFRPAKVGTVIEAVARPKHVGGRSQVWEIEMQDKSNGKSLASCLLTLAVIELASLKGPAKTKS